MEDKSKEETIPLKLKLQRGSQPARMSWNSCVQSSKRFYSSGSDTWSESKGRAGRKMQIVGSFSEIPVQTAWTASRYMHATLVMTIAFTVPLSLFICTNRLDNGY